MKNPQLNFARKILAANNIQTTLLTKEHLVFDLDLRNSLYGKEIYKEELERIQKTVHDTILFYWEDVFQCNYYVMKIPHESEHFMIGPFLNHTIDEQSIYSFSKQIGIPISKHQIFVDYYQNLSVLKDPLFLRNIATAIITELYGETAEITFIETYDKETPKQDYTNAIAENENIIHNIEKRYGFMKATLHEVSFGNTNQALAYLAEFQSMSRLPRLTNAIKDTQTWLTVYNTSLRNKMEETKVPTYEIHQISTKFSYIIENVKNPNEKEAVMIQMTKEYCDLINQQASLSYSSLIQHVIRYIRMNLSEEISLASIAETHNVNASYLSKKFHDEVHVPLTDYINHLRIEESLGYLKQMDLPIKDLISKVGIYDMNYYTRLFKKYMHTTPSVYRKTQSEQKANETK